jgi:hypothetical protein
MPGDPFPALHDGERSFLLERKRQALGRKDKYLTHQICRPPRETGANRPVVERLVPDLVLDVVEQMLRKLDVACCHGR